MTWTELEHSSNGEPIPFPAEWPKCPYCVEDDYFEETNNAGNHYEVLASYRGELVVPFGYSLSTYDKRYASTWYVVRCSVCHTYVANIQDGLETMLIRQQVLTIEETNKQKGLL